jgi:hypothetical protein
MTQTVELRRGKQSISFTTVAGTGTVWCSTGATMNLDEGRAAIRVAMADGWRVVDNA